MIIEIPDSIVEEAMEVDAVYSGRAWQFCKNLEECKAASEEADRKASHVADQIISILWKKCKE